uniref:Protein kinase domain-containing protein n=1 Tax=Panagrellus redivivus TaxID=6233 RepID=A0A7E4UTQ8_PANRE
MASGPSGTNRVDSRSIDWCSVPHPFLQRINGFCELETEPATLTLPTLLRTLLSPNTRQFPPTAPMSPALEKYKLLKYLKSGAQGSCSLYEHKDDTYRTKVVIKQVFGAGIPSLSDSTKPSAKPTSSTL